MLGRVFFDFDRYLVDGIVAAIGLVPQLSGFAIKLTTQRGYLQGYAASMLVGMTRLRRKRVGQIGWSSVQRSFLAG